MNDEILKGVDGLLCKLSSKDAAANIQQAKAAPTNSNKSMFTAVDIANTDNILTKLIRYFCIKNRITLEDYVNYGVKHFNASFVDMPKDLDDSCHDCDCECAECTCNNQEKI